MEKRFNCPKCGSDMTRRATALYKSGTRETAMIGLGMGRGRKGESDIGPFEGTGTTPTHFPERLAPPAKPSSASIGCGLFLLLFVSPSLFFLIFFGDSELLGATIFFIFIGVIGLGLIAYGIQKNKERKTKYLEDYAQWERLWYCRRCGHTFYLE